MNKQELIKTLTKRYKESEECINKILDYEIKYLTDIGYGENKREESFILNYKDIKTEITRIQYYVGGHIKEYWYIKTIRKNSKLYKSV